MNKIIKGIQIFFLLVGGLAIMAHMIIPHDHHTAESVSCQDDLCPVSGNNSTHHTGFPIHCHACNDLTSEKAAFSIIIKNIQFDNFFAPGPDGFAPAHLCLTGTSIADFTRFDFKSDIQSLSQLRAPPSLI